jgi:hypothetical protein
MGWFGSSNKVKINKKPEVKIIKEEYYKNPKRELLKVEGIEVGLITELKEIVDQFLANRNDLQIEINKLYKEYSDEKFKAIQLKVIQALNDELKRVYPKFKVHSPQKIYDKYERTDDEFNEKFGKNIVFNYFDNLLYLTTEEDKILMDKCSKNDTSHPLVKICIDINARRKQNQNIKKTFNKYKKERSEIADDVLHYNANIEEIAKIRKLIGKHAELTNLEDDLNKNIVYVENDHDIKLLRNYLNEYKKNPSKKIYDKIIKIFEIYCDYLLASKNYRISARSLNNIQKNKNGDIMIEINKIDDEVPRKSSININQINNTVSRKLIIFSDDKRYIIIKKLIELNLIDDGEIFQCDLSNANATKYNKKLGKSVFYFIYKDDNSQVFNTSEQALIQIFNILQDLYTNHIVLNMSILDVFYLKDTYPNINDIQIKMHDNNYAFSKLTIHYAENAKPFKELLQVAKNNKVSKKFIDILEKSILNYR